jgi:hypothetical protein
VFTVLLFSGTVTGMWRPAILSGMTGITEVSGITIMVITTDSAGRIIIPAGITVLPITADLILATGWITTEHSGVMIIILDAQMIII